jgi:hypothetical protein
MKRIVLTVVAAAALIGAATAANAGSHQSLGSTLSRVGSATHLQLSRHALKRVNDKDILGLGLGLPLDVPMQYGGGPVQQSGSTTYAIFWEPPGSVVSAPYHGLIQRYFQDIGGSAFYGLMTQYYQGSKQFIVNASSLGGSWVDTRAFTASPLQDSDLRAEVVHAMSVNGWAGGINHQFFVFTPKGVNSCNGGSCSFTTYCAYHGFFNNGGTDVLYASMPYAGTDLAGCGAPSSPNGDASSDAEISIISHEHFETVTDPHLDAWNDIIGSEIGDKCRFEYGAIDAQGANLHMNGHPYVAQEEYSNRAFPVLGTCAFS